MVLDVIGLRQGVGSILLSHDFPMSINQSKIRIRCNVKKFKTNVRFAKIAFISKFSLVNHLWGPNKKTFLV